MMRNLKIKLQPAVLVDNAKPEKQIAISSI